MIGGLMIVLRYYIVAGKNSLEHADLGGDKIYKIDKERAGVLVGTGMGGLAVFADGVHVLKEKGYRKLSPFFVPCAITNTGSALLAMEIGFMVQIIQFQQLVLPPIIVSMLLPITFAVVRLI
ncbi:hypothetical protein GH714_005050 [Hevea brasiliensis]|uniref:beta-ketoacyl-[acyl-carrier-protein] synthase I n=1 Tax=Hevea brasiliensis TaxID=3981 RepID=A0A6A6LVG3_HEVBR|nr:hypothetical protein GH714_005050 [Hevea brasiliensis]